MFLQWRMPYVFRQIDSMETILQLHLSQRIESVIIGNCTRDFSSSDFSASVLLSQQIPVQIQRISLTQKSSSFVLDMFLKSSACAKGITLCDDHYCTTEETVLRRHEIVLRRFLQCSHIDRFFVSAHVLLFLKQRGVDDLRLRLRTIHVEAFTNNLPFLLSRLDDDDVAMSFKNQVEFVWYNRHVVTAAQQIIDFCAAIVSKFAPQPRRAFHLDITATIDTADAKYNAALDDVFKMMELRGRFGCVTLYSRDHFLKKWT
jgi:hypothetical protein